MVRTVFLYLFIILMSTFLGKLVDKTNKRDKCFVLILLIIILLSTFAGFRSTEVGLDSQTYAEIVQEKGNGNHNLEIGFVYLIRLFVNINSSYTFSFFAVSLLTNSFIVLRLLTFRSKSVSMAVMMFIYTATCYILTFSGQRQWLAVSMCFFATKFIYNNKKIRMVPFAIIVAVAFLIHNSAILSLSFLAPIIFKKTRNKKIMLFKFLIFVLLPIGAYIGYQIASNKYFRFLSTSHISFGYMGIIKIVVLVFSTYIAFKYLHNYNTKHASCKTNEKKYSEVVLFTIKDIMLIEFVAVFLSLLGYFFDNVSRIYWYFLIYSPLYYGLFLKIKTSSLISVLNKVLMSLILIATLVGFFTSASKWAPYYFFWE